MDVLAFFAPPPPPARAAAAPASGVTAMNADADGGDAAEASFAAALTPMRGAGAAAEDNAGSDAGASDTPDPEGMTPDGLSLPEGTPVVAVLDWGLGVDIAAADVAPPSPGALEPSVARLGVAAAAAGAQTPLRPTGPAAPLDASAAPPEPTLGASPQPGADLDMAEDPAPFSDALPDLPDMMEETPDAPTSAASTARGAALTAPQGGGAPSSAAAEVAAAMSQLAKDASADRDRAGSIRRDAASAMPTDTMAPHRPELDGPSDASPNTAAAPTPKSAASAPPALTPGAPDTIPGASGATSTADMTDAGMELMDAERPSDPSRDVLRAGGTETRARPPLMDAAGVAALASRMARRAADGSTRFQLRLDPPELGRVDVRLHIDAEGVARAHLTVERPEALQELTRHARAFERAFQEAGVTLDRDGLDFDLAEDSASGRDLDGDTGEEPGDEPGLGAFEGDASADGASPDNDGPQSASPGAQPAMLTPVTALEDAHGFTVVRHAPLDLRV